MSLARRILVLMLLWLSVVSLTCAQKSKSITKDELAQWINEHNDCPPTPPPYFYRLDYYDFTSSGSPQAIVVASTCMTGTAGPDVHSVFSRDSRGELIELPIAESKDPKTYDNLFGNRNYDLTAEDGLLVASFGDDPDRDTPLVIKYKWNGKEFAVDSIQKTGVFPTSYDCGEAQSEVERAICHVDTLADLDCDLAAAYKSLLSQLPASERNALRTEQRQWLVDRDKRCAPYKGWVQCLTDFYQQRIDTLKKRSAAAAAATAAQKP